MRFLPIQAPSVDGPICREAAARAASPAKAIRHRMPGPAADLAASPMRLAYSRRFARP